MLDTLHALDVDILLFFNQSLSCEFLDNLYPYFNHIQNIWWIMYILVPLLCLWWFYKSRLSALRILLALIITAGISDTIGYRIIKPNIMRVRPNNNPVVEPQLRVLRDPGSQSFPSNHAMSSFAIARVLVSYYPFLIWVMYPLATIIALFRLYAGVHYPTDVLGGIILGILLGYLLQKYIFKKCKLFKIK